MSAPFKLFTRPELKNPSLLVSWNEDVSQLGNRVTRYLSRKLPYQNLAEIEPEAFFPLGGVSIEDSIVQFPESRFFLYPDHDLIILSSDPPGYEWHQFLGLVLDIARELHVREIYTIGGMISLAAHTAPRQLMAVFTSVEVKQALNEYNLAGELDYKTPPGQRPTLSSFLLWAARKRNLPGVNLWIPIPFYLLEAGDPGAQRQGLEFLNRRFGLGIDLADLDEASRQQNTKMAELRHRSYEIDRLISKLESNQGLSPEENEKLAKEVDEFLGGAG